MGQADHHPHDHGWPATRPGVYVRRLGGAHAPIQPGNALLFHWAVSHVPTGLSVGYGIPNDRVKKLCQQLHRIVGDTPITGQGMPGVGAKMRQQISRAVRIARGHSEAEADAPLPRAGGTR